jgi:hypothetical protein
MSVVLAHGAWADGSSWSEVIAPLAAGVLDVFREAIAAVRTESCA